MTTATSISDTRSRIRATVGAESSQTDVFAVACSSRTLLSHVTSKWGVLVIVALAEETLRWNELGRLIEGISEKMLAQTLRTLETDGFVLRTALAVVPPHVEYSLTDKGHELAGHLLPLVRWISDVA